MQKVSKRKKKQFKFPHSKVSAVKDLTQVDWTTCEGVQKSADGSEGVLFVLLKGTKHTMLHAQTTLVLGSELWFGKKKCELRNKQASLTQE